MGILDSFNFPRLNSKGRIPSYRRPRVSMLGPGQPVTCFNQIGSTEFNSGNASGYTFQCTYVCVVACTDIQLAFLGWQVNSALSPREAGWTQSNVIKCSVALNGGTRIPVAFGRERPTGTGTSLDQRGSLISNPVGITCAVGDVIVVQTWNNVSTGNKIMHTSGLGGGPGLTNTTDGFVTGDNADVASPTITAAVGSNFTNPIMLGQPLVPTPSIACLGDSISAGAYDVGGLTFYRNFGWFTRACTTASMGAIRLGASSMLANDFAAAPNVNWITAASCCSHLLIQLGRNDLSTGRTAAQIIADMTTLIAMATARGMPVILATIPPRATSSDDFITVVNQTKDATEADRLTVNQWMRALPSGVVSCIDIAAALEVNSSNVLTVDGGFWRVPTSTLSVSSASLTTNVATITTTAAHGLVLGQAVVVGGVSATFNGVFRIASVPSTTTFTYAKTAANTSVGAGGTVSAVYTATDNNGVHPESPGHVAMAAVAAPIFAALTVA